MDCNINVPLLIHLCDRQVCQNSPTILPEMDLGVMSIPCCMNAPSANQRLLITLKWLLTCLPRHKYVDEVQKSLQRELPLFLTLTLLSATHTGKTLRTKGLSLSRKVPENTYYYIGLSPTLHNVLFVQYDGPVVFRL